MYYCPICEEPTEILHEGYCLDCCIESQRLLDRHNAAFDRWKGLTEQQCLDEIADAIANIRY